MNVKRANKNEKDRFHFDSYFLIYEMDKHQRQTDTKLDTFSRLPSIKCSYYNNTVRL
jgi:hypothetical protein